MKILVCIKQVPPMEELLELDQKSKWLSDDDLEYRINRFDEFAIEEALLIKEATEGTTVDIISVGSESVDTALRRALGMGAERAIHIEIDKKSFISPLYIAERIGNYAKEKSYDLILTGIMSEDAMQSMVGPSLASILNIPCAAAVVETEISDIPNSIVVKCELEGGRHQEVQLKLPALLTVQSGINKPRYPSLSNVLRANKQDILKIEEGPDVSSADKEILSLSLPEKSKNIRFLEGTVEEKAAELIKIFKKKGILKG